MTTSPKLAADASAWTLSAVSTHGAPERGWDARLSLSNGFLGAQASSLFWSADLQVDPPRAYAAGVFADDPSGAAALRPVPEQLVLTLLLGGRPWTSGGGAQPWRRRLDLRRGVLTQDCEPGARAPPLARVRTSRRLSLSDRALDLQSAEMEFALEADAVLAARWRTTGPAPSSKDLRDEVRLWREARHALARAWSFALRVEGELKAAASGPSGSCWRWRTRPGQTVSFEAVSAYARGDGPQSDPASQALEALDRGRGRGFAALIDRHERAWEDRWAQSEVEIEGDPAAQTLLRYAVHGLNAAADPADPGVSLGARGLTGEDYKGHVFWETEAFLMAFYVLTWPEAARSLLAYRYDRLDAARAKAARLGWRGAFFAWESADSGEEAAPDNVIGADGKTVVIHSGRGEVHISGDVALAVWRYWRATGDDDFFQSQGAEMLIETARLWASRATLESDGRRHIRGVEGPDEYHQVVDDNAFTNGLARWNLRRAVQAVLLLERRWPDRALALRRALDLKAEEPAAWSEAAETLVTGLDPSTGVYEQFAGFFNLEKIDLADYADRKAPMDVVLGADRVAASQIIKQPDVVALQSRLPELFGARRGRANFKTYEPLCSHGSSLSPVTHALVAARLGEAETALRYLGMARDIDLGPKASRSIGGVHLGALGGVWQTAVLGFGGLAGGGALPSFAPRLPRAWSGLSYAMRWRGRSLRILIRQDRFEARLEDGAPMAIRICGRRRMLEAKTPLIEPIPNRPTQSAD